MRYEREIWVDDLVELLEDYGVHVCPGSPEPAEMGEDDRYGITPLGNAMLSAIAGGRTDGMPRKRQQAPKCPACQHHTFVGNWKCRRRCVEPACACRCYEFFEPR